MTYRERMRTIEFCVEHVAGRIPVIAGAGSNSTEVTLALCRDAQRTEADGVLLVTPYYNKATQTGLLRHYTIAADALDIPVILYNVPSRTGVNIAPETYAELAKHPNINGVKEASGDLKAIQANYPEGEGVIIKWDDLTYAEDDIVKVVGRQYGGFAVTEVGRLVKLTKPAAG